MSWAKKHKILSTLIILFVLIIVPSLFNSEDTSSEEQTEEVEEQTEEVEEQETERNQIIGIGEEGLLDREGHNTVAICWTEDWFDAMIDAAVANDEYGWTQLFYDGKCYFAPSNTKVLVLDLSWGATQFRILEGDFMNEMAWTNYEYIVSA